MENPKPNSSYKVGGIFTGIIIIMAIAIAIANPVAIWGPLVIWPLFLGPIVMAAGSYWQKDNNQNGYIMTAIFISSFLITSASLWL
jgi:hypothetical protein